MTYANPTLSSLLSIRICVLISAVVAGLGRGGCVYRSRVFRGAARWGHSYVIEKPQADRYVGVTRFGSSVGILPWHRYKTPKSVICSHNYLMSLDCCTQCAETCSEALKCAQIQSCFGIKRCMSCFDWQVLILVVIKLAIWQSSWRLAWQSLRELRSKKMHETIFDDQPSGITSGTSDTQDVLQPKH